MALVRGKINGGMDDNRERYGCAPGRAIRGGGYGRAKTARNAAVYFPAYCGVLASLALLPTAAARF
ncbi:hypothetical protein AN936_18410 [Sphingopyxis macrogoltabida]|uniref:Uncharacterized protein n=1 Tax=Sphingopyxis macrogoltabida TaxID=33050 RepID=A0A0N9V2Y1_SPHMC|nr:hypothetical protein AN936_18410 [Sphingopyxis macrogoltabida]